jgi:hypothetical protein
MNTNNETHSIKDNKKPCPIGLEECIPRGTLSCLNFFTCYAWTKPWPLPLTRVNREDDCLDPLTFDSPYWLVKIFTLYPHLNTAGIMQERNWIEYFAKYGYAEVELLPGKNRRNDGR